MKVSFKKIVSTVHLWLGLASGLIVFIVGITGCILAFEQEIKSVTQPYQFVRSEEKPFLKPSVLIQIAAKKAFADSAGKPNCVINSIQYNGKNKAAIAVYNNKEKGSFLMYLNPYHGWVLKEKELNKDFFRIVLGIHFYLLLPAKIGQPIVATAILLFVLLLITGCILWLPKHFKWNLLKQRLTINWRANFKRTNYDVHNVLGFYSVSIALILALTGLVWGFEWFEKGLYFTTSGGKVLPSHKKPLSDTTVLEKSDTLLVDVLWNKSQQLYSLQNSRFQITIPIKSSDCFTTSYNPSFTTFYQREIKYYDKTTLQELYNHSIYNQTYANATKADKLYRMNYDIHVGAIAGLAGKIIVFFASLIAASLPVTGFLIWRGRKRKKISKPVL